jgi:hypothetical protein
MPQEHMIKGGILGAAGSYPEFDLENTHYTLLKGEREILFA